MGKNEKKKVGVARLKPTKYDNPKGTRIGPSLFLHIKNTLQIYHIIQ